MSDTWELIRKSTKRAWHFFWEEDSVWSWLANILVAFIIIKFVVYPLLGLVLGTGFPLVAVVSESMEHGLHDDILCGQVFDQFPESFDNYWATCGNWYEQNGITKEQFKQFPLRNGFDKGDVIILWRANSHNIHLGDVLVFQGGKPQPIIHRVVKIWQEDGSYYYQTKGDHNSGSITGPSGETNIGINRTYGKGLLRIPYLGWVKILVVDLAGMVGIQISG
ncbi:MAG: signal peptidase I [Candidatus Woesearchaeota archaeon]|jgi:signal peptidase I